MPTKGEKKKIETRAEDGYTDTYSYTRGSLPFFSDRRDRGGRSLPSCCQPKQSRDVGDAVGRVYCFSVSLFIDTESDRK